MSQEKMSFKKRIENYWYYYKYHTIIISFLCVALVVALVQCVARDSYDYNIVLATQSAMFTEKQVALLESSVSKYGEDLNGDGKVTVGVNDCSYGPNNEYDMKKVKQQKLQLVVMSNENSLLYITDEDSFSYINGLDDVGFLVDLGLPNDNGRSFILADTEFCKTIEKESGQVLPKGLRISRRLVDGTLIAKGKNVDKTTQNCDKLINAVVKEYYK